MNITIVELLAQGYRIRRDRFGLYLKVPRVGKFYCASRRIAWLTLVGLVG